MSIDDGPDTARYSWYVDSAFYAELAAVTAGWSDEWPAADPSVRYETETFLFREARLLDDGRFNDWLDLYGDECLYWVPVTRPAATRAPRCPTRSTTAAG